MTDLPDRIDAALESGHHCFSEIEHLLVEARDELRSGPAVSTVTEVKEGEKMEIVNDGGDQVSLKWLIEELKKMIARRQG